MGTKNNPGVYDCASKAEPDEPTFTLLGRDPAASVLVMLWAALRYGDEPEKRNEAMQCAAAMANWARDRDKSKRVMEAWLDFLMGETRARLVGMLVGYSGVTGMIAQVQVALQSDTLDPRPDLCEPPERMLRWFAFSHLPGALRERSRLFADLARQVVAAIAPGPERTVALRKLLESKDAAVRATLAPGG